jgi:hypothetical protein
LARAPITVDSVRRSCTSIHRRGQRRIAHSPGRKIGPVKRKVSRRTEIGSYINRVRSDRNRTGEIHLLPARRSLSRERRCRQQRPRVAPEMSYMYPRVVHSLIEANPADESAE